MVPALDDVLLKEHAPVIVPVLVPSPSNVQVGSAVENVHDEVLKAHVIPLPTIKFTGLAEEKVIVPLTLPVGLGGASPEPPKDEAVNVAFPVMAPYPPDISLYELLLNVQSPTIVPVFLEVSLNVQSPSIV